ncbi:MAG: cupredoxin family copper-binding protein [Gemmatimonadaceae bacterium]|nr:cupredoxin family copper-binding protein [Gemmatimonadaceae bacterium]
MKRNDRRLVVARTLSLLAGAALLAGCGSAPRPRTVSLTIENLAFTPATATVAPGDTLVWTNRDLVPHTVTARDGAFDSGSIAAGATWTYVAPRTGTVAYYCVFHPTMQGTLDIH